MNWEKEPVPHFGLQTQSVGLGTLPLFKRRKDSAKEEADCGAQGHIGHANGTGRGRSDRHDGIDETPAWMEITAKIP
jgi:hypothetical protein